MCCSPTYGMKLADLHSKLVWVHLMQLKKQAAPGIDILYLQIHGQMTACSPLLQWVTIRYEGGMIHLHKLTQRHQKGLDCVALQRKLDLCWQSWVMQLCSLHSIKVTYLAGHMQTPASESALTDMRGPQVSAKNIWSYQQRQS